MNQITMKIEKIILKEGEKKPKNCYECDCNAACEIDDNANAWNYTPKNCPIVEQPAITDPESLDNTLSQHEEIEGYEFVMGVGGSVDCNNCEILDRITMCPKSCVDFNGYYKRKE